MLYIFSLEKKHQVIAQMLLQFSLKRKQGEVWKKPEAARHPHMYLCIRIWYSSANVALKN